MACLLCEMWARMPYAKKYTTPTTAQETEGALVVGYWLASRRAANNIVARICERHMAVVVILDQQEEKRMAAEAAIANQITQDPHYQAQVANLQERQTSIVNAPRPPANPVNQPGLAAALLAMPPVSVESGPPPFSMGPGPLTNENSNVSVPPPGPVEVPLRVDNSIRTGLETPTPQSLVPLTPNGPQEAKALIDAPCLFCKVMVKAGEIHSCPLAGAKSS